MNASRPRAPAPSRPLGSTRNAALDKLVQRHGNPPSTRMRTTPSAARRRPNGILVAGGHLADAEEARERVELVGERHGAGSRRPPAAGRRRSAASSAARSRRRPTAPRRRQRVVAPHHALQLGELAHHAGEQVGLGEFRRALGVARPVSPPAARAGRCRRGCSGAPRARAACRACCDRRSRPAAARGRRAASCGRR